MKATGLMVKQLDKADLFTLMVMSMLARGKMIKRTDMEFTHTSMVHVTKDFGEKINNMVRVLRHGLTGPHTEESMSMVKSMELEFSHGPMGAPMKANLPITTSKARESINGAT